MGGMIEAMEPRRMLAAPVVVGMTMAGTETEVTGVVLTFSQPLDPATAQNPRAYFMGRTTKTNPGDSLFDPFGLFDQLETKTVRVRVASAAYDPAAQTVTLTPAVPFNLNQKFRRIRISGGGNDAVNDASGARIDGNYNGKPGGDLIVRTRLTRAKSFNFRDADGDRARLRLDGPGRIWAVRSKQRLFPPVLFLNRTNALKTELTGKVKRDPKTGDGVATIGQISGVTFAAVSILTDPAFRVNVVSP
jgi:hypothetical protein